MLSHGLRASASQRETLLEAIKNLGLTANLQLCLDSGDAASYDPAVQTAKWLDTSGNGYDFFRGTSGSGDTAEPTFNGQAGILSIAEYWSFDGGDYFLYDTTNETWMQNLHKNNALFTIFGIAYSPNLTSSQYMFATRGSTGVGMTANFVRGSTGKPLLFVANAAGTALLVDSTLSPKNTAWNSVGISVNEATSSGIFTVNNSSQTFTSTYTSPSTANAAATGTIGATGGGATPNPNNARLACLAIWEGIALTSTDLLNLHNAMAGRFGL